MNNVNSIVNDLVNAGVVGFDTGMKVMGQTPVLNKPLSPDSPKLKPQPHKDEVIKEDESLTVVRNPLWKKLLFGALTIGGLVYGGYKLKAKLIPLMKKGWTKLTNLVMKPFRKPAPSSTPPAPAP